MSVVIIKYNAGNIFSVACALKRLGVEAIITADKDEIRKADKVIFPGVGEAGSTMGHLSENQLDTLIKNLTQPVLGICLGMQLMCASSEEGSHVDCLNIFDAPVRKFKSQLQSEKIPHMGWNTISNLKTDLFREMKDEQYVYFVHSYYVPLCDYTIAATDYIQPFSAALHKDNFYATQFHPEKSGGVGELILRNFLDL